MQGECYEAYHMTTARSILALTGRGQHLHLWEVHMWRNNGAVGQVDYVEWATHSKAGEQWK
jgi:hypothetical protein